MYIYIYNLYNNPLYIKKIYIYIKKRYIKYKGLYLYI